MYRNRLLFGLLIALFCVSTFMANADIEKGLHLYLPLNEGTGTPNDLGPNGFDTELSKKGPSWVDAKNKNAPLQKVLEFNGKSENFVMIDMAGQGKDIDSHAEKNGGLSICAWVKVIKTGVDAHGQTRQPIVMKGAGGAWEFSLYVYDNLAPGMSVWNCDGSGVSEPSGGNLGNDWHYQCGTFDAKKGVMVYLDAEKNPVSQAGVNANIPCDGNRPVFIAHREDGQWLNAVIAEVRMWDRVIEVDEMKEAMETVGGLAVRPADKLPATWGKIKDRRF